MTKFHFAIIVASLAFIGSLTEPHAQNAPDPAAQAVETEVRAVMLQMRQAAEKLQAEALYSYVLDSSTPPIIEAGRVAPTRAAALQNTAQGLRALTSLSYTYTRESITVMSPTTVLWVGEGTASATLKDGREVSAPFAETIVLVKRNNEWKVLHAHRSAPGA